MMIWDIIVEHTMLHLLLCCFYFFILIKMLIERESVLFENNTMTSWPLIYGVEHLLSSSKM